MKIPSTRQFLVFVAFASMLAAVFCSVYMLAGPWVAAGLFFALNASYATFPKKAFGVTLTTPQLLLDVIDAFRKKFPLLNLFGTEFRGTPLKLNQKYIAHIASYGSASTYDPTTGYRNGAQDARNGLVDVPVVTDQQPTYPLKWKHLDMIKDIKQTYQKVMAGAGYILGKGVVDNGILAKCTSRYFTKEVISTVANADYDALQDLVTAGNGQGMQGEGRVLIVNSAVASILAVDPRMVSKDYAGQLLDGRSYRQWQNVGGFALIQEYPDLPSNNGAVLTGITGVAATDVITKATHGLVTGDPFVFNTLGGGAGLTALTRYWVIKIDANTFKLANSYANAAAGTAIDFTTDITASPGYLAENLIGMMFDARAFGFLQGAPDGIDGEMARQLGIPTPMLVEPVTDTENGISMAAAKWQDVGTGDLFWVPTFVYGTAAGKQADTAVAGNTAAANSILAAASPAGTALDYAGIRLTTGV